MPKGYTLIKFTTGFPWPVHVSVTCTLFASLTTAIIFIITQPPLIEETLH